MRACIRTLIINLVAIGCATTNVDPPTTETQGIAEIRVDATQLLASSVTHVTVEAAGQLQDLVLNPFTSTFDGTLILPTGPKPLVARAFSGETQVGVSHPTSVDVQPGIVTRVTLRILDTTTGALPSYGPIVDSLTYPTTVEAGAPATLAISVVAPGNDPVSYAWAADCEDSTFSANQAATTSWSKATQGACTINVVVSSNGFTTSETFMIVVFPAGAGSGGVSVTGVLVTTPTISLSFPDKGCFVSSGGNASCTETTLSSPSATTYGVAVTSWGASLPGTLEISDNCGGRFGTSFIGNGSLSGSWLPPVAGGLCILTARAVNGDDLVGTLSAAILTRPGTPATALAPQIDMRLNGCSFRSAAPMSPVDCGQVPAGSPVFAFGFVAWLDGLPGSLTITDDCGGGFVPTDLAFGNLFNNWSVPNTPGTTCTMTVQATNLQGVTSEATAQYHLL